ncbi:MAG: hypothetical protein NW241_04350 [Bacteroidia bacterium]|nr:hypothetical protein [Bacteroidia bacterium]
MPAAASSAPLSADAVIARLEALYALHDRRAHGEAWRLLMDILRNGLDYSQGSPLLRIWQAWRQLARSSSCCGRCGH